jgi:peptidoglycan hydrolase CwlO-like protein
MEVEHKYTVLLIALAFVLLFVQCDKPSIEGFSRKDRRRLRKQMRQKDANIANLNTQIREKDAKIANLNTQIRQKDAKMKNLENEKVILSADLQSMAQKENQREFMENQRNTAGYQSNTAENQREFMEIQRNTAENQREFTEDQRESSMVRFYHSENR